MTEAIKTKEKKIQNKARVPATVCNYFPALIEPNKGVKKCQQLFELAIFFSICNKTAQIAEFSKVLLKFICHRINK